MPGINNSRGWQNRLLLPTFIDKIGQFYFIIDNGNNRVLFSRILTPDIATWHVMDSSFERPHSIASDGVVYVADDTDRNAVRVYTYENEYFKLIQIVEGLGLRPHRTLYHQKSRAFYVMSSNSQSITKLIRDGDRMTISYQKSLPFLKGFYTRSMSIIGEYMYFVSGPGYIIKTWFRDDSYNVIASYKVPAGMESMNDLFFTGNYHYLTSTPANYKEKPGQIVRVRTLDDLNKDKALYEDIFSQLNTRGSNYYISSFDGRFYITQIFNNNRIVSFIEKKDGAIADVKELFNFELPTYGWTKSW